MYSERSQLCFSVERQENTDAVPSSFLLSPMEALTPKPVTFVSES